jgi:PAS domain S-box-containing protein
MASASVTSLRHSRPGLPVGIRSALTILGFAAAFFVVQRITFSLRFPPFERTTVWTPGSLFFAALLLTPPRRWWPYVIGLSIGVFAAYYGDGAIPAARAMLAVPCFCAAVMPGAWLLRRWGGPLPFGDLRALTAFTLFALVIVPVITAAPVDVGRYLAGADDFWPVAVRSVLCVALGTLIATPALTLTFGNYRGWARSVSWARLGESAVLIVALFVIDHLAFGLDLGAGPALLYAPLPLLIWAAVRFELAGVCWALLLLAFQSTWGAIHGRGPFAGQATADGVLQLQLFLLAISLPLMFLATVIREVVLEVAARRRSEERFRLVVESAPNAILIADTLGQIVLANARSEDIFGYRRNELVGQSIELLVPERYRDDLPADLARFFAMPSTRPMGSGRDLYGCRRDGSEFPIEIGLTLMQTPTGPHVLYAIVDITARKRAEEAQQELAHASRLAMVGELTASIAHEINQPLGAILSNADAAEMMLEAEPPAVDEVRHILSDIRKDDLRANDVIQKLRGLLRKRDFEMQALDLNDIIAEVIVLVRGEARRRGVTVENQFTQNLPPVQCDKVQLQQILLNLFLNGMEAMAVIPGDKRLTIYTTMRENGCAEVGVCDSGPGIAPENLARIFEPFFSTKKAGMGLGLSISRSLVEGHGGRIWAENLPDGGAIFRFTVHTDGRQSEVKSVGRKKSLLGVR